MSGSAAARSEASPEYGSTTTARPSIRSLVERATVGMSNGDPRIDAIEELARRAEGEAPVRGKAIRSAGDVAQYLRAKLAPNHVEEFWALTLDVRHRVMSERMISRGSLTGVEVHPRDAFRPLIAEGAAAVIFCHNHPSGDPEPSRQDVELTRRLRDVGDLCGIAVLDHVVVGTEGFTSLAERGWK